MSSDFERHEFNLPTAPERRGYRRLADFMAWEPGVAIFPRFQSANLFNLLGLQAEVCQLQEELANIMRKDDQSSDLLRRAYSVNWSALQTGDNGNSEQRLKILELRSKLAEYNSALMSQIAINQQPNPQADELEYLRDWLKVEVSENSGLHGPGSLVWFPEQGDEPNLKDKLVVLSSKNVNQDKFTRFILKHAGKLLLSLPFIPVKRRNFPTRESLGNRPVFQIYSSSDDIISVGNKIATVLASLLTTIPVVVLNFISSINLRLGLIVMFTLLFSSVLAFMGNASRVEVFGASAAFAAVQVVFVGSVSRP
ncbi:hypothetical protein ASPBRDRAFT_207437 [Aspergillus brasiliensis CBS 101740]|uniref:DUF6594 domain-containing protein n=1 Tax=Aspergillus brasiliensis (strain CBS 101740 / IMI 381727 / IBT 21946) TaxID=767769 RepID=A0A1L9UKG0_ASPBC|nr:hypothetical protein ASPBRDRAFT_207437 [Aspergillus brasiliensis CBS 101740]